MFIFQKFQTHFTAKTIFFFSPIGMGTPCDAPPNLTGKKAISGVTFIIETKNIK